MAKKTETYTGPWPRKRHYHRCETCWKIRKQGAVYCYKSKCSRPLSVERCEHCQALTPTATYTPTAAFEQQLAEDHAQLRTRIGNTPTCEDCGQALDHCECEDADFTKCRNCGEPNDNGEGWDGLCGNCADRRQLALFGGEL